MTFVADESVIAAIVDGLRDHSRSVVAIAEEYPGWKDEQVLAFAFERGAILLTQDKDFGLLVYGRGLPHRGVVLMRLEDVARHERRDLAVGLILQHDLELADAFTVIGATSMRIRRPDVRD